MSGKNADNESDYTDFRKFSAVSGMMGAEYKSPMGGEAQFGGTMDAYVQRIL